VQRIDDRVEHPRAGVSPSCGVERHGQVGIAIAVQSPDACDERCHRATVVHPRAHDLVDGRPHATTPVAQERDEQLVARPEVVADAGICHPDEISDGTDLDALGAAANEQRLGGAKDQVLGLVGGAANSSRAHRSHLTLTEQGKACTLRHQGQLAIGEDVMPMVDLTLPRGRFDSSEQEALAAELSRLIIHWESGTDRPGYDQASWAFVQEADLIAVGGRPRQPGGRQVYRVVVSVPKGSLDDRRRRGLMSDVAHAVIAAEGGRPTEENLMRVWCIVDEVPDGNWGVGAGPLRLRDLAQMFGLAPGDERWAELQFDQR